MTQRIILAFLLISLTACNFPGVPAPTPQAPTEASGATLPQATEIPSVELGQPTATPAEPSPALEAIVILQPGPLSAIISPVTVAGQSRPTFEQNLVVAVNSEDGGLLTQQATTLDSPAGESGNYSVELQFSVSTPQTGRISVYETSAMDGGIVHLTSVEVTLLAGGAATIQPADIGLESIRIELPAPMAEISGGVITVSGFSDYYFESNLGLWLCGAGGSGAPDGLCGTENNILAVGNAMIDAPEMGQPGPFSGQLTYSVSEQTPARIVVFAASPRDGGLLHVSSIPILLSP